MKLIYINAKKRKGDVVVRIESIDSQHEKSIVNYFFYNDDSYDRAKLLGLVEFFKNHPIGQDRDTLTIFTGSSTLFHNWPYVFRCEMAFVEYPNEWMELYAHLKECKYLPDIKARGCLSDSMQDELVQYIKRGNTSEHRAHC